MSVLVANSAKTTARDILLRLVSYPDLKASGLSFRKRWVLNLAFWNVRKVATELIRTSKKSREPTLLTGRGLFELDDSDH